MTLFDFMQKFPNEESCVEYLKNMRLKQGIECKKCKHKDFYWKKDKEMFECKECGHRFSLKTGTIMEDSNLSLHIWFEAIHLLSSTKKTFSALEIQRQLDFNRYEPIWKLLHKIRWAMGKRDEKYKLTEYLGIDEGFFKVVDSTKSKEQIAEVQKRGRGSVNHSKVLVLVESAPVEEKDIKSKHQPKRKCGHIKMTVMNDLKSHSINQTIENKVDSSLTAITDKYKGYSKLKELITHEEINTINMKEVHKVFPWVHSAIGNAKNLLRGVHHSTGKEYLQSYLNEFCYKYNRRYFKDKFDRLLIACISV